MRSFASLARSFAAISICLLSGSSFLGGALLVPGVAAAQPAGKPAPARGNGAPVGKDAPAAGEAGGDLAPENKALDVDDPMLAPLPAPPHVLSSWNEALTRVTTHDIDLKMALLEVERARGQRRQVLSQSLPQISATGAFALEVVRGNLTSIDPTTGITGTTLDPASPVATAQILITQPILAMRSWYAVGTADKNIELNKLSVEDQRRTLVTNVANAIVDVVSAEHVAEINRAELKASLGRLKLTNRSITLGVGAKLDVVRFEQDVVAARATLVDGDEALMEARERLGLALSSAEPYGVPKDIKLDDIETNAEKTCKRSGLEGRADIRALYAKKGLAEREVTDADLEYVPTANLVSTMNASSQPIVGDTGRFGWNVMAVLTVPIWDGGLRYGDRRVAKVDVAESKLNIENAERQGKVQISSAERQVQVEEKGRQIAEHARDLAKENLRLVQGAFEGGTDTSFDLVDASTKLREAELGLAGKELDLTRARLAALLSVASCEY